MCTINANTIRSRLCAFSWVGLGIIAPLFLFHSAAVCAQELALDQGPTSSDFLAAELIEFDPEPSDLGMPNKTEPSGTR